MIEILLKAGFLLKKNQFLGVEQQDGHCQTPMDVVHKTGTMFPSTIKKETQAYLGIVGFWRMPIPDYSQTVSPLYHGTQKSSFM